MRTVTREDLEALLADRQPPCISIYQPVPRSYPDSQQGPILYRNLLRQAEEELRRQRPGGEVRALLQPFEADGSDDLGGLLRRRQAGGGGRRLHHDRRSTHELAEGLKEALDAQKAAAGGKSR